ncbi:MAG: Ig-like domain-containing protein [Acidobacteria bacterium]|nr:Ig-like domain-containing protein [Acidobacteriota bacterium]
MRLRPVVVTFGLALALVGCSKDSKTPTAPSNPTAPSTPTAPTIQSLRITAPSSLEAGKTAQLTAATVMSDASSVTVSPSSVQWQSSNTVVAAISASGLLTALQAGIVDVRGTYQQWTSNAATVTVTTPPPPWTKSGVGNDVFDMPTSVSRVRIVGTYTAYCSNFIVRIGGRLTVNEILGTCPVGIGPRYEGVHLTSGDVTEITNSSGVSWSFTEVR